MNFQHLTKIVAGQACTQQPSYWPRKLRGHATLFSTWSAMRCNSVGRVILSANQLDPLSLAGAMVKPIDQHRTHCMVERIAWPTARLANDSSRPAWLSIVTQLGIALSCWPTAFLCQQCYWPSNLALPTTGSCKSLCAYTQGFFGHSVDLANIIVGLMDSSLTVSNIHDFLDTYAQAHPT